MTDTTINTPANQVPKNQATDQQAKALAKDNAPHTHTNSTPATPPADNKQSTAQESSGSPNKEDDKQITYKPVDIMVYGKIYTVNCPVGEEAELRQAGKFVNGFVQNIRRQAPHLTQEELLVLCCLDMYETMQSLKNKNNDKDASAQKALNLVNKMLADAQTMLS